VVDVVVPLQGVGYDKSQEFCVVDSFQCDIVGVNRVEVLFVPFEVDPQFLAFFRV
jgi:hypothetical protein